MELRIANGVSILRAGVPRKLIVNHKMVINDFSSYFYLQKAIVTTLTKISISCSEIIVQKC